MNKRIDLSVGQRLGLGFVFKLAVLAGLLGAMVHWNEQSAAAERHFIEHIAPLNDAAAELDHALVLVTIGLRSYLVAPDDERMRRHQQNMQQARNALLRMGQLTREPDAERLYQVTAERLEASLLHAEALVQQGPKEDGEVIEAYLSSSAASSDALYAFAGLQRTKAARALQAMQDTRETGSRGLASAAALSMLVFGLTAFLMARSIRKPVGELLHIAASLGEGNWQPAAGPSPQGNEVHDEMHRLRQAFGDAAIALEARERKLHQLNAQIQAQNDQLEQQARALRAQAESLEAADRRKSEFLGVLAHELRNPMSSISNSLHALGSANIGHQRQAQDIMRRQMKVLSRLVDDLLDLTRITSGKVVLQKEIFDLAAVVQECAQDYQATATKEGVELKVVTVTAPVEADRTRVAQVISNLFDNAIKFSNGAREVEVTLEATASHAELRVKDRGVGIEAGMLERLFQPFSQADTTLARRRSGLGLGLSLSKVMVEMHAGTIDARSKGLGAGAEFIMRLPTAVRTAVAREPPAVERVRPRRKVLIIDDISDAALSLRDALRLAGHEVKTASGGVEGLEVARAFRPEVLLCDLGLPTIDGFEVAQRFRADEVLRSTFLIAVTGYAGPEDRERSARAGFDRHIRKPPDLRALDEMMGDAALAFPAENPMR